MGTHTHTRARTHTHAHTCAYTCEHTYTHTLANTYTHAHTLFYFLRIFHAKVNLVGFHGRLSDSKSPLVSRTLLNIRADLNNAAVWIISARLPFSSLSTPLSNPLGTVPSAPTTIGITIMHMFHSLFFFLCSLAGSKY